MLGESKLQLLAVHSLAGTSADGPGYGRIIVVGADLRAVTEAFLRGRLDGRLRSELVALVMGNMRSG